MQLSFSLIGASTTVQPMTAGPASHIEMVACELEMAGRAGMVMGFEFVLPRRRASGLSIAARVRHAYGTTAPTWPLPVKDVRQVS